MADTYLIGGDLLVRRLGFGALRLTDDRFWGPPPDRDAAIAVARRAAELEVSFVDTADAYGLGEGERLLAEALYPYPALVIATKAGQARPTPDLWVPLGRPEYLRQQVELSLRRLRASRIDLLQLHRIDPGVPLADQLGALRDLRDEGKIRHIGLSEVSVEEIRRARQVVEIVSVQNRYHLADRGWDDVVDYCAAEGIAFIAWWPLGGGRLASADGALADVAAELSATPAQVSLAWLLRRSPNLIPIPGTRSVRHLEENLAAAHLSLSEDQYRRLT
jgi:aryl-alcohol dehydrogenase-like predicted oxidoreductase